MHVKPTTEGLWERTLLDEHRGHDITWSYMSTVGFCIKVLWRFRNKVLFHAGKHTQTHTLREKNTTTWTKVYRQANTQAPLCIFVYTRFTWGFMIPNTKHVCDNCFLRASVPPRNPMGKTEQSADEEAAFVEMFSQYNLHHRKHSSWQHFQTNVSIKETVKRSWLTLPLDNSSLQSGRSVIRGAFIRIKKFKRYT